MFLYINHALLFELYKEALTVTLFPSTSPNSLDGKFHVSKRWDHNIVLTLEDTILLPYINELTISSSCSEQSK